MNDAVCIGHSYSYCNGVNFHHVGLHSSSVLYYWYDGLLTRADGGFSEINVKLNCGTKGGVRERREKRQKRETRARESADWEARLTVLTDAMKTEGTSFCWLPSGYGKSQPLLWLPKA